MSGFSIAWLDLREPADLAARDRGLAQQAVGWLERTQTAGTSTQIEPSLIVDLGAGTGSTLRAMTAIVSGMGESGGRSEGALTERSICQRWRLVDLDGGLLREAKKRHGDELSIECHQADLSSVSDLPLTDARLVTASALFDLASRSFVNELVARLVRQNIGLYAALNYNGITAWAPEHPLDAAVLEAFNRDQRRNKGLGPALGPGAAGYLQQTLEAAGFRVWEAPSPWQLGSNKQALTRELIAGIAAAVAEGYGFARDELAAWREFRRASVSGGSCTVGHTDLLALPVDRKG